MLWQTRKKLRQFARQRIQNLDVTLARRRSGAFGFLYYLLGWNLVGGALVYIFFFVRDPESGKKIFMSPDEMKIKFQGPPAYILVKDEEGRTQQERNPAFDQWLADKDAELESRKKEIYEFKKKRAEM